MAKYNVTYECGHEGVVDIIGPVKDREWKREQEENKMCPDCWKEHIEKVREQENKEAKEKAKEMELPELTGSPKQIAWANTLRQKLIDMLNDIEKTSLEKKKDGKIPKNREEDFWQQLHTVRCVKHHIIENRTSAKYFIDNRHEGFKFYLELEMEEALKSDEEKARERIEQEEIEDEKTAATVYPEDRETNAVVEIEFTDEKVTSKFEKNEEFRLLVREFGYRWDYPVWYRDLKRINGTGEDRAAELGNALLNAGFPIMIMDEEARKKAVDGTFEPEHKRWVQKLKDKDRFAIRWMDGRNEKLYQTARSLPGSRWENPFVTVSVNHYEAVEEFAELYGFKFDEHAEKMKQDHIKSLEKAEVVTPATPDKKSEKDGLEDILKSGDEILDDLKD